MNNLPRAVSIGRYLRPGPLVAFLVSFFFLYVPLCYWFGWNNPALFDLRGHEYPAAWASVLNFFAVAALILIPLGWIAWGRAIDVLAIQLLLHGMIMVGYYLLPYTAPLIYGAEKKILSAGEQVVAINAIGFFTLLLMLGITYFYYSVGEVRLPPMRNSVQELDRRLRLLLLPALGVVIVMIATPMVLTRSVPMLSGDPMAGRAVLEQSDLGRLLYNFGSSLLPALAAGNLILSLRRPGLIAKVFSIQTAICAVAIAVQFLTGNRQPIANILVMFLVLWSLERRHARLLLVLGVVGFLVAFLSLGGFSSIIRQTREMLGHENLVLTAFRQAFLGGNLSDLRDGAWVFGSWDYVPLNGKTYLGGLAAILPSSLFPAKKDWYLGLVALQIVHWPTTGHFGLRISFFAEAFLNFGLAGVIGLGVLVGSLSGYLLKKLHLSVAEGTPCLTRNLVIMLSMQLALVPAESSQGFIFYALLLFLTFVWLFVYRPVRLQWREAVPDAYTTT